MNSMPSKDFDSLSQAISQSVILNIFKRNRFKFVILMNLIYYLVLFNSFDLF